MDWAAQSDDLAALAAQEAAAAPTAPSLAATLELRLRTGRPHAHAGASVLLALAAGLQGDIAGGASPSQYAAEALAAADPSKEAATTTTSLPPHPLQLASSVFAQMSAHAEDQTVIFFGIPGSGKSTWRRTFSQQLIELSKSGKKKSRVLSGAAKMEVALEAFGHARTPASPNASCYGRYAEYQFSSSARMVGVKLLDYALDHARVSAGPALPDGERSFNIFYQLLAGATQEERDALKIADANSFLYLKGSRLPRATTAATGLARSGTLSRRGGNTINGASSNTAQSSTLGRTPTLLRRDANSPATASAANTHPSNSAVSPPGSGPAGAHSSGTIDDATPTPEDAVRFEQLREHLKSLGIGRRLQTQIFRVLAAILHLGNISFATDPSLKDDESTVIRNQEALETAADLLGVNPRSLSDNLRYRSKFVGRELCSIYLQPEGAVEQRNALAQTIYSLLFSWLVEHLNTRLCKPDEEVATFIGLVDFPWYRAQHVGSAAAFPIFVGNYIQERLIHYAQNVLFDDVDFILKTDGVQVTVPPYQDNQWSVDVFRGTPRQRGIWSLLEEVPEVPSDAAALSRTVGVLETLDDALKSNPHYLPSHKCLSIMTGPTTTSAPPTAKNMFGIRHFHAEPMVQYDLDLFLDQGTQMSDFVALFRGAAGLSDVSGGDDESVKTKREVASVSFAASLFSRRTGVRAVRSGRGRSILNAQKAQAPMRKPSIKRKKKNADSGANPAVKATEGADGAAATEKPSSNSTSIFATTSQAIDDLMDTLKATRHWSVVALTLSDIPGSKTPSLPHLQTQLETFGIPELCQFSASRDVDASHGMKYTTFTEKYAVLFSTNGLSRSTVLPKELVRQFVAAQYWPMREVVLGNTMVFLSVGKWRWIHAAMKRLGGGDVGGDGGRASLVASAPPQADAAGAPWVVSHRDSFLTEDDRSDIESNYDSEYGYNEIIGATSAGVNGRGTSGDNRGVDVELGHAGGKGGAGVDATTVGGGGGATVQGAVPNKREIVDSVTTVTSARRCWVCCTWSLTWWIPSFILTCCGLKRPDIRMAWREKVALCVIIMILCLSLLFFIVGLRYVICPTLAVKSQTEIGRLSFGFAGVRQAWFMAFGRYYFAQELMNKHIRDFGPGSGVPSTLTYEFESFYGTDVSKLFYNQARWNTYCPGIAPPQAGWDYLADTVDWMNRKSVIEPLAMHRGIDPNGNPLPYMENLNMYAKGRVGWTLQAVSGMSSTVHRYIVIYDNVYYVSPIDTLQNTSFSANVRALLSMNPGQDITAQWSRFRSSSAEATADLDQAMNCMNSMFYIGTVDRRDTFQCRVTNGLLLSTSIIIVAVIGIKFLAALQFGSRKDPEECDKFVICMVPCYTEGSESLTKTLDSLAILDYDDKRKLLFVICDGMIIGSGNDRPTPRLVLDILGVDPAVDPPALEFQSLGEGSRQLNMGKVYSGLYDIRGHSVPYVVIVKVGTPAERVKPGNRGKRDSQLVLMRFLNRVHFNAEFSPLEIEIYHHMKNIIGVSPSFYEFVLMVDADTEVESTALNRMVSVMVHDVKVMGLCGETRISNEKDSWVTAIQVYEYFISHHLAKAFESLFGTVTCLPGCFCMYRVRSAAKNVPLLVSSGLLTDYSENTVATLHMKNLLHLGEDRYLTTLMLKHFPGLRTKFASEARCYTVVPDRWSVLLSQRRRWINSTVHNLFELVFLDQLCGFCCFSMRFVVLLDLFSTFVQPATILYVAYLVYSVTAEQEVFPLFSIILIASIYGLQVIIFVIKREWQHIMWMLIYILAMPIFSFWLPLYSFWHFDDFSWGNTRVVVGEGKKTVYVADAEPFDPAMIVLRRWRDQGAGDAAGDKSQMSWEHGSQVSKSSMQSGGAHGRYPSGGNGNGVGRGQTSRGNTHTPSEYSVATRGNENGKGGVAPFLVLPPPQPPQHQHQQMQGQQDMRPVSMVSLGGGYGEGNRVVVQPASTMPMLGVPVVMNSGATTPPASGSARNSVSAGPADVGVSGHNNNRVMPTDEQLLADIRRVLASGDLMTLTKKQIRDDMGARFGVDLRGRKDAINRMIDDVLQGRL